MSTINKINFVGSSFTECIFARAFSCIKIDSRKARKREWVSKLLSTKIDDQSVGMWGCETLSMRDEKWRHIPGGDNGHHLWPRLVRTITSHNTSWAGSKSEGDDEENDMHDIKKHRSKKDRKTERNKKGKTNRKYVDLSAVSVYEMVQVLSSRRPW